MANMKEAVAVAAKFVEELFPEARDIRLEEIVANGSKWEVVVSFRPSDVSLHAILAPSGARTFKQVEVERDSGEPVALRVWQA